MEATAKQLGGLAAVGVVTAVLVIAAHARTAPSHHLDMVQAHSPSKVKSSTAQPLPYIRSAEVDSAATKADERKKPKESPSPALLPSDDLAAVELPVAAPAPASAGTGRGTAAREDAPRDSERAAPAREQRPVGSSDSGDSDREESAPRTPDDRQESAPRTPDAGEREPVPAEPARETSDRSWWDRAVERLRGNSGGSDGSGGSANVPDDSESASAEPERQD